MSNPLDRPHTLLDALVYFTDCQIATFDQVARRKGSSKFDVKRHYRIASMMLKECQQQHADEVTVMALAQNLFAAKELGASVHGILVWGT